MCNPAFFHSGSSNPEVSVLNAALHSISSHCYTVHRKRSKRGLSSSHTHTLKHTHSHTQRERDGERWRERAKRTVNSVTRSKLVTDSEPQALLIHHTVAAGFYYCKTTRIRVHTKASKNKEYI